MDHLEIIIKEGVTFLDNCHRISFTDGTYFKGIC